MADETPAPIEEDVRHDDLEYNPALERKSAKAWLNLLQESEDAFEPWNTHCDRIDRKFAFLERLGNLSREREFQMFWANMEVLKPSIYAKPPVPVVVPKFKDRRPVYQAASELMERVTTVAFDLAYINETMLQIRDDIAMISRGVAWCRLESNTGSKRYGHEKVCIDFKHRRDFLHSISRCWYEVAWVAAASYLTRAEARERFYEHSGNAYQDAEYRVDKDSKEIGGADDRERAKFWEIWHKNEQRVVWVAVGCEDILDEAAPHLDVQGFFPCPKPAYGTTQRGSLVPVPDMLQYEDQLDEVDLLTGRIHALSDALEAKGFYPAGGAGGEISDAIQTALKIKTPGVTLVPISNWAAFGGSKEIIVWMPIAEIAQCITTVVELRKQIIDDIYQIMGLSDIMRGATDARETLGAQELKTQYGSVRIRDKQNEIIRVARDLVPIIGDIILDKFSDETIIEMSQTQLPTEAMQQQAVMKLHQQLMQIMAAAQALGQQQQPPQAQPAPGAPGANQGQQQLQQLQQQGQQIQAEIEQTLNKPTIQQVLTFLRDKRMRAFVLDIETDSTILIDENREKQQSNEFLQMLGPVLQRLMEMMAAEPRTGEFCGEVLKLAVRPYRAGRSLDGAIDELVELAKSRAEQPQGDDQVTATNKTAIQIEQIKDQREREKDQGINALKAAELRMKDQHEQMKIASAEKLKLAELMAKQGDAGQKAQLANQKMMHDRESHQAEMIRTQAEMAADRQKMAMAQAASQAKMGDIAARQSERQAAQQFKMSQPQNPTRPV